MGERQVEVREQVRIIVCDLCVRSMGRLGDPAAYVCRLCGLTACLACGETDRGALSPFRDVWLCRVCYAVGDGFRESIARHEGMAGAAREMWARRARALREEKTTQARRVTDGPGS